MGKVSAGNWAGRWSQDLADGKFVASFLARADEFFVASSTRAIGLRPERGTHSTRKERSRSLTALRRCARQGDALRAWVIVRVETRTYVRGKGKAEEETD